MNLDRLLTHARQHGRLLVPAEIHAEIQALIAAAENDELTATQADRALDLIARIQEWNV